MLKKKISTDYKLADLENDTHRLLFTWAIAHLDVEGRITGNPREFSALVVPLLKNINSEQILDFFADAVHCGLIHRYEVNGQWVIQYPKFLKNQNIKPEREAKSIYPPENNSRELRITPENSAQIKINEVKLSKEKLSKAPPTPPKLNDGLFLNQETKETLAQLLTKYPTFPSAKLIGIAIGQKKHPDAILYALKETLAKANTNPGEYFLKTLNRKSGDLYADEHTKKSQEFKADFAGIAEKLKRIQ